MLKSTGWPARRALASSLLANSPIGSISGALCQGVAEHCCVRVLHTPIPRISTNPRSFDRLLFPATAKVVLDC